MAATCSTSYATMSAPLRRRSSQYSLFPNCSPVPQDTPAKSNSTTSSKRNSTVTIFPSSTQDSPAKTRSPNRNSIASSRRAAEMCMEQGLSPEATNDAGCSRNDAVPENVALQQSADMEGQTPLQHETASSHTRRPSSPAPWMSFAFPTATSTEVATPILTSVESSTSIASPAQPAIPYKSSRRSRPSPVTDLTILPYTGEEWRRAMDEVKALYSKGQYKHCSLRCKQILEGIRDSTHIHPLHSIYLSFFAASSLEMIASTLHTNSRIKLSTFQESLSMYQQAEQYIEYASVSADPNAIHTSCQEPRFSHYSVSSARSSVDSIFSAASASSAISSISSIPDSPTYQEPGRQRSRSTSSTRSGPSATERSRKKKVSFSLPSHPAIEETSLLDAFPNPPSVTQTEHSATESPRSRSPDAVVPSYLLAQAITRYRAHLLGLSSQLQYHMTSIETQIRLLSTSRILRPRRSHSPTGSMCFPQLESVSENDVFEKDIEGVSREEVQKVELRERITRLKQRGWKRQPFDGERYRVLCEKALWEVNEPTLAY